MKTALLIGGLLLAMACGNNKQKSDCTVTSMGACAPNGRCGATMECKGKPYEIKCTPPAAAGARQVDCQCVDGGVLGKTVQLAFPVQATTEAIQTACGWK